MIQQCRPFSFVSKLVYDNHSLDISPSNQIATANSSSLIGRYLEERLDVYWSTVMYFIVVSLFAVWKCGYKGKWATLLNPLSYP